MSCYNSISVKAPVDKVWASIRDFHGIQSWAPNVVEKIEVVGDLKGDQIGAKRVLNDAFHETLQSLDDLNRTFSYTIDDGPGPTAKDQVSSYVGTVRCFANTADNSTFVVWTSEYDAANGSAVAEFCNPIYQALLKDLAGKFV